MIATVVRIMNEPERPQARVLSDTQTFGTLSYFLEWKGKLLPIGYSTMREVAELWQELEAKHFELELPAQSYLADLENFYLNEVTRSLRMERRS